MSHGRTPQREIDLHEENLRLREALKLALLRMRGVTMEHKTSGHIEKAETTQRWADNIAAALNL